MALGASLEHAEPAILLLLSERFEHWFVPQPATTERSDPLLMPFGGMDGTEVALENRLLERFLNGDEPVGLDAEDGREHLVVQRFPQLLMAVRV